MNEDMKRKISGYLPHMRDPELGPFDYYVRDEADRCYKVYIREILPYKDTVRYTVYTDSGRQIKYCLDAFGAFPMGRLYDNKQDCKDGTHDLYDSWEWLRSAQQQE